MSVLDRYLGSRLLSTLAKTVVSLVLLFILIDLLTHRREDIVRHEVPWPAVLQYYGVFVPKILYSYQIAAVSMLIATLIVLGGAAQRNEITAALAGGIGLRRIAAAPVFVAMGLAAAVFAMQETLGTAASREAQQLENRYFSKASSEKRAGVSWARLQGGWSCHVMKFNRVARTGEGVFIFAFHDKVIEQILANRIFWDETAGAWLVENGRSYRFDLANEWRVDVQRITQAPAPIQESPDELFALDQPPDAKTVGQLARDIRRARAHDMPVQAHITDLHAKFAQPALCFVMVWLAIPFALRLRRGGIAVGFGVSIAIALVYLMLFRVSMGLGHIGRVSPVLAAWFANALFMGVGLFLFRKTPT